MSTPFISFFDQAMHLAHSAGGQQAVIQLLWRYHRPVDLDALTRFRDNLSHSSLTRLIRPALLPFGRHQWVSAPHSLTDLTIATATIGPEALQDWADAQVALPLDPQCGPAWRLTAQALTDGSTVVSLIVSHCIADGMATALAVSDAVLGERRHLNYPAWSAHRTASTLAAELLRAARDVPATLRALAQLARTLCNSRNQTRASPPPSIEMASDEQAVVFPSVCMRVPASVWEAKAQSLDSNRFTLLVAMTAAFGEALGRVRDGHTTLLIPANQREGRSDTGANRVSMGTLRVPVAETRGPLQALKRRLKSSLLRAKPESDSLNILLPLVPFIPKSAFSAAGHLALGALADLPVTCSNMGDVPADLLRIDGTAADRFCFRGIDRQVTARAIEARQGVATVHSGVIPGWVLLNFVAYQPGTVTESHHLRKLVERLLATYDLTGESFDDQD